MKSRFLFLILILLGYGGAAQSDTITLTLDEAIRIGLRSNFDIRIQRNDSLLNRNDLDYTRYAFYPRLNATGGYLLNNNNQRQVLADGTKRQRNGIQSNNLNSALNLQWTLFDGMRMFINRDRLRSLVRGDELAIRATVSNTVAEVMRIWYDIVRLQQSMKAVDEQRILSAERLRFARARFEIGTGIKPDVLQSQIDLNAQLSTQLQQLTAIANRKQDLANLIQSPFGAAFYVLDSTVLLNPALAKDTALQSVPDTNPELQAAKGEVDIAAFDVRLRRAERYPSLDFNAAYNFNRNENKDVINPFQPLFNQNKGFNYGITITAPIFNGYITRRNIRAAEIAVGAAQLQYERTLALARGSAATAARNYNLQLQALTLEDSTLGLVRENIFIARERFRLGVSTFLEMREIEQSLAESQARLIQTLFNAKLAEIELMRVRGELVR